MAYLRGNLNGGAFTKRVDAVLRHYRVRTNGLLDFAGTKWQSRFYGERVYQLHRADSIGSSIKRFAAKKAGVEDGRNQ